MTATPTPAIPATGPKAQAANANAMAEAQTHSFRRAPPSTWSGGVSGCSIVSIGCSTLAIVTPRDSVAGAATAAASGIDCTAKPTTAR